MTLNIAFDELTFARTSHAQDLVTRLKRRLTAAGDNGASIANRNARKQKARENGAVRGPVVSSALSAVNGNRYLLKRVIAAFLEECPRLIEDIDSAHAAGDAAAIRRAAHSIKCSMRLFGVEPGSRLAGRLQGIDTCHESGVPELLAALRAEFERVQRQMNRTCGG